MVNTIPSKRYHKMINSNINARPNNILYACEKVKRKKRERESGFFFCWLIVSRLVDDDDDINDCNVNGNDHCE